MCARNKCIKFTDILQYYFINNSKDTYNEKKIYCIYISRYTRYNYPVRRYKLLFD